MKTNCLSLSLAAIAQTSLFFLFTLPAPSQEKENNPGEAINEKAARYLDILQKRPGGGYLFDRFYNAWLDTGSLDGLRAFLTRKAESDGRSTADSLILAFFHSKQGDDEQALAVFSKALAEDPGNAAAWFEKAKISARTLDFQGAVSDLDRAAAGQPKQDLALEIAKLKGRLLVRSGKNTEAMEVWKSLLETHPNDEELHEDLVELQIDEGLFEEAVATSAALVAKTKDPYQKVLRQLRTGDIHLRTGKRNEAIAAYEQGLAQTGSDTWIEKEILSQIEQVFRREDDISGLSEHLAKLIERDPQRTAIVRRRAEVLMELNESEEAAKLFGELLAKTPGDRSLREGYVDLLRKAGEVKEAVSQMEELIKQHQDDPELLVSLANLQHQAGQTDSALASLAHFLTQSGEAEFAHLRVARLQEAFEKTANAEITFQGLIKKFPDSINAKESFASFLHRNKKREQAVAIWKELGAQGGRDQAVRMARSLMSRQENEPAFEILQSRYAELQNDPVFLSQLCAVAIRLKKYEEAVDWAVRRVQMVDQPVDMESAVKDAATIITNSKQGESLTATLREKNNRSPQDNCLLAELLEKEGDHEAVDQTLAGASLLILSQRIRILRLREDWKAAADATKQLLSESEGRKSAFLRDMVGLYRRAQIPEEAQKWIPEWKKASPGSVEPWIVESSMHREAGESDAATEVLRTAARKFEDDVEIRAELAASYAESGKNDDARRIYMNLFENSDQLSGKIRWIGQLATLARNDGKTDQLIEEFRERRRNNRQSVAPLLALAEIHRGNDEYEERRQALLEASRLKPKDVNLILEIARIEDSEGDWEAALKSLARARALDDSPRIVERVAAIQLRNGDEEEGYRLLNEMAQETSGAESFLRLADSIASRRDWERLSEFLESQANRFDSDYRVHLFRGIAFEELGKYSAAADNYTKVLSVTEELPSRKSQPAPRNTYYYSYLKGFPPAYRKYITFMNSRYQAYRYRQGGSYSYSPSGVRISSSTIGMPANLEQAHAIALAHLSQVISFLDDTEANAILNTVREAGGEDTAILCKLHFDSNQYNFNISPELLDSHPENLSLHLLWLGTAGQSGAGDLKHVERSFSLLEKDYPALAVQAGLAAVKVDPEAGKNLFEKSIALIAGITSPDISSLQSIAYILQSKSSEEIQLSKEHEEVLRKKLMDLYPIAKKEKNQYSSWIFWSIANVLGSGDDPSQYVKFLEEKVADAKSETKQSRNPYTGYSNRHSLIAPLPFPPRELNKYPFEVLVLLQDPNNRRVGFAGEEPSLENYEKFFEAASEPVMKLLLANRIQLEVEKIQKLIEATQQSKDVDPLAAAQITAGWHASQGNFLEAAQVLNEVRFRPMSRSLRRTFDAALVHAAIALDNGNSDHTPLIEAGKSALLRLAYTRLDPQQRGQLITAMTSLGMEAAAEKEEAKSTITPAMSRSSRFISGYSSSQNRNRIQKLIDSGKRDAAVRDLANQIRLITVQALHGQDNNWRRYGRNVLGVVEKQKMTEELLALFEKESSKNSTKLQEYAGAALILNEQKLAAELFQRVVSSNSRAKGARKILASLFISEGRHEEATQLFEDMSGLEIAELANLVLSKLQSGPTPDLEEELNTFEALLPLFAKADHRVSQHRNWPVSIVQRLVRSRRVQSVSLGNLYRDPEKIEGDEETKTDTPSLREELKIRNQSNEKRWTFHDRLVAEMWKVPQLAAIAYDCECAGALSRGRKIDRSALAKKAMLEWADLRDLPQFHRSSVHDLPIPGIAEQLVRDAWEQQDQSLVTEDVAEILQGKRQGAQFTRELKKLAGVYFSPTDEVLAKFQSAYATNSASFIGYFEEPSNLLLRIVEHRKLGAEAISEFALEQARRAVRTGNTYPNQSNFVAIAQRLHQQKPEVCRSYLSELTRIYCGNIEERSRRDSNVIQQYSYFLAEVAEREGLLIPVLEVFEEEKLKTEYLPDNLRSSQVYSSLTEFRKLFENSPLLAEQAEEFRIYAITSAGADRRSVFEQLLYRSTRYGTTEGRKEIHDYLRNQPAFGSQLLIALIDKDYEKVFDLGKENLSVFSALSDDKQSETAEFFQRQIGSKPVMAARFADPFSKWIRQAAGDSTSAEIEKFLSAKHLRDIPPDSKYELESYASQLMIHLERTDPEKLKAVFYKAAQIGAAQARINSNAGFDRDFPLELLRDYAGKEGHSLTRLQMIVELLADSEKLHIDHPGHDQHFALCDALSRHLSQSLKANEKDYGKSLTTLFTELHQHIGDDPVKQLIVAMDFREFLDDFANGTPEKEAVNWINQHAQGKPYSTLATQFAMSARLFRASLPEKRKETYAGLKDPDSFVSYFEAMLLDDKTYPRHLRLALAHHLFQYARGRWSASTLRQVARDAIESLHDDEDHCSHETLNYIVGEFAALEADENWLEIAALLPDAWKRRSRFSNLSNNHPLKYQFDSDTISALFEVFAKSGNERALNSLSIKNQPNLNETGSLVTLVRYGLDDRALSLLQKNKSGLRNDYDRNLHFSEDLAQRIGEFLPTIEDRALRHYAEVALVCAPDPPRLPGESAPQPSPLSLRVAAAAKKFESAGLEGSLRDNALSMLTSHESALPHLDKILAKSFAETNFERIAAIEDYSVIRDTVKQPFQYVKSQLKEGNTAPAIEVWKAMTKNNRNRYSRYILRDLLNKISFYDSARAQRTDEVKAQITLLKTVIELSDIELLNYVNRVPFHYVTLTSILGYGEAEAEWFQSLPKAKQTYFVSTIRKRGTLIPTMSSLLNGEKCEIPPEERLEIFKRLNLHPVTRKTSAISYSFFRRAISSKIVSFEQLEPVFGELLEAFDRNGYTAADIASCYSEEERWDEALKYLKIAEETCPANSFQQQIVLIARSDYLMKSGRKKEAVAEIEKIDVNRLPSSSASRYRGLCKDLGVEPKEKSGAKK